jgi:two-component system, chemotaxis family, sensor kinase CheA
MQPSFESFQHKFIEEALDNISDLEQALLELELSPNDKELIERVFRAMHSLKGGGAMFGFDKLSEFTHRLENIYDLVRAGKLSVSANLLSVTLNSVDMLRSLLDVNELNSERINTRFETLGAEIEQVMIDETQNAIKEATDGIKSKVETNQAKMQMATYYIHFYPGGNVLKNGTNTLYLIDELKTIGEIFSMPGVVNVPDLELFDPLNSYLFWDLFVSTDKGVDAIMDVFIFVEESSAIELHSIGNYNLFDNKQFVDKLNELSLNQGNIELSDFNGFVANVESSDKTQAATNSGIDEAKTRNSSSIRVASEKIDGLMNLVSELVITQERLNLISSRHHIPELKMVTESVQKLTSMLRDSTFSISLIPIENLLTRFQRLVRDLSSEFGKQIVFSATGAETELDKSMIESLTDPLLHIIRNSIDHGIEMPDVRRNMGKDETGKIVLEAGYSGANVIIKIKDDGAGIDPKRIRAKAIEKGIVAASQELPDSELLNLVFLPGFSTNSKVTEVSGRGVGMDVVKRNIQAIRGEVGIESEIGKGTSITITLPMVLSIIDGLLVHVNNTKFIIPMALTHRIYSVDANVLEDNFINAVTLDGIQHPFFNLRKELNLKGTVPKRVQIVVVIHGDIKIAIAIDRVIGKIQAVLKPLGRMFNNQKVVSAATIMGDGTIALVLDTNTIIKEMFHQY